jgi:hypothetical protein
MKLLTSAANSALRTSALPRSVILNSILRLKTYMKRACGTGAL